MEPYQLRRVLVPISVDMRHHQKIYLSWLEYFTECSERSKECLRNS